MKSPFPGMDPYLELRWGDVHSRLTTYASDALNRLMPAGLIVRAEERSIVCDDDFHQRDIVPDVSIFERGAGGTSAVATDVSVADSVCLVVEPFEFKQHFLEIRDARSHRRVVTVVEFVSPTNKRPGEGLDKYRQKQRECFEGDVNLVEIDLTRAGDRSLLMPVDRLLQDRQATYMAAVWRATRPSHRWLYRLPLQQRLGGIPIPLRPTDQDVVLDLQTVIDQIYENGRYEQDLSYSETLNPPLPPEDQAFAEPLLARRRTKVEC